MRNYKERDYAVVNGMLCKLLDGKVTMVEYKDGYWGVPYRASRYGGWDNAYGEFSPDALRARINSGTVIIG